MSDYDKGRNGEYMQNSYGNQEYQRGQSDAKTGRPLGHPSSRSDQWY